MEQRICFGVDIGGTAVKAGMFDIEGNLLEKWEFSTVNQLMAKSC